MELEMRYFVLKLKNRVDAQKLAKALLDLTNKEYPEVMGWTLAKLILECERKTENGKNS